MELSGKEFLGLSNGKSVISSYNEIINIDKDGSMVIVGVFGEKGSIHSWIE